MANDENLVSFKSGKDWNGNAKGRIKGSKNRSTIIREMMELVTKEVNPLNEDGDEVEMTQEEAMTMQLIMKAKTGDVKAYTALMDSGYGKPKQEVTTITDTVKPPSVRFTDEEDSNE